MTLNDNIKKYRKNSGLTQKALAEKAGLSFSMVSKLESGEQLNPSFETLNKISGALKISPEKLVSAALTIEDQIDEYIQYKRGLSKDLTKTTANSELNIISKTETEKKSYNDLNFRMKLQAINNIPRPRDDYEDECIYDMQRRPEIKKLVSSLKNASKEEIEQVISLIETLQRD